MKNSWNSPEWLLDRVNEYFGHCIEMDMATNELAQKSVLARNYHTLDNPFDFDTDLRDRVGFDIWCNPPYEARKCFKFCKWLSDNVTPDNDYVVRALLLIPNSTETKYFQEAARGATKIAFSKRRIKFIDADTGLLQVGNPKTGHALLHYGDVEGNFEEIFGDRFWFAR